MRSPVTRKHSILAAAGFLVLGLFTVPLRARTKPVPPALSSLKNPPLESPALATSPPLAAPPFDPASPEARAAKQLDKWRTAMAIPRPVEAPAWILMDVDSGRILGLHNADTKMFPASTTKTLMALTALSAIGDKGLDRIVKIGPNPPKTGEQSINLLQGEQFTFRDLLRGALIKSANDACVAVAEGVAGNVPDFVKMMNAKARKVGAIHSHFANPHGLHDPNHYTTARDLALIARAAMKYPFFNETIHTRDTAIHGSWKIPGERVLINRNRLLWRWNDCDGVKTGYTRQAGRCLIASATRSITTPSGAKPFRLLCVVLHARDSWSDSAQLLLHQGFEKYHPVEVARDGEEFGVAQVEGEKSGVKAVAPRAVRLAVRADETEAPQRRVHLRTLHAPVKPGQVVGALEFLEGEKPVARVPLVAGEPSAASAVERMLPNLPSHPPMRLAIYGCALGGLILLIIGLRGAPAKSSRKSKHYETSRPPTKTNESRDEFLQRIRASNARPQRKTVRREATESETDERQTL